VTALTFALQELGVSARASREISSACACNVYVKDFSARRALHSTRMVHTVLFTLTENNFIQMNVGENFSTSIYVCLTHYPHLIFRFHVHGYSVRRATEDSVHGAHADNWCCRLFSGCSLRKSHHAILRQLIHFEAILLLCIDCSS
jgi:hypothetical protein